MALEGIFNTPTQPFDLFYIFVEVIFGSVWASAIGIMLILILIGWLTRQSPILMIFIVGSFLLTMGVGYVGALAAVPIFIFGMIYFSYALINFANSVRK